jgi:hypothetical protein
MTDPGVPKTYRSGFTTLSLGQVKMGGGGVGEKEKDNDEMGEQI